MSGCPGHQMRGEHLYEGMVLPGFFRPDVLQRVPDLVMTDQDILVASYPKTGTTWSQELVWLVATEGDFEGALASPIQQRYSMLEMKLDALIAQQSQSSMRLLKTHLRANFVEKQLNNGLKVVLVIRNPKDTLVSMFYFYKMHEDLGFTGTWDEFFEMVKVGKVYLGDYFEWYMSWIPHLNHPNVLLLRYEYMHTDLENAVKKVSHFLKKNISDPTLQKITTHLAFESMRKNPMTNYESASFLNQEEVQFLRKGVVGDWKNHFTKEQSDYIDQRYEDTLKREGILLQFE